MTAIDVFGWAAIVTVLACYWLVRSKRARPELFDVANVVLCVPVALPALVRGAYSSASISLVWGAIGAVSIWRFSRGL